MSNETEKKDPKDALKAILDPEEQLREFGKGKLKLATPIRDGDTVYEEISWDFTAVTGMEYADAMDRDFQNANVFRITVKQALNLFAIAAEKATPGLASMDVIRGLGIMDTQKATQAATIFFTASNRAGNLRISRE